MFSYCKITHPATTIEHSVNCHLYNSREENLVTAGADRLTVYRFYHDENSNTSDKSKDTVRLEYVQSFELYGNVASLQKVCLNNKTSCERDSLAISFNDAKLSIVEYCPETHDLKTVSMHHFEDEELRDGYVTNHAFPPIIRVDPEDRCIAMLIYGRHIVVIPIDNNEEEDLENELYNTFSNDDQNNLDDEGADVSMEITSTSLHDPAPGQIVGMKQSVTSNYRSPVLPSYKLDLSQETCGEMIDNIVDIQFLHNYNDPTLVILHEPNRTWSGRVAMRQDTFAMVALSMNLQERLQPIIWVVNNLPYDCLKVLPVPKPIGGLLVLACNELIYLNQSVPAFGMSFNSFTKESSNFHINEDRQDNKEATGDKGSFINIGLDLSQAVFLNHTKILFILKDGDVYLVTLFNDDMRSIKNFHFERIASTVQPNCLTLCENNLFFIGSHVGDSILAQICGDLSMNNNNLDAYDDVDDKDSLMSTDNLSEERVISFLEQDRILSTSACGRICYGQIINRSPSGDHKDQDYEEPLDPENPSIELIGTAGQHKSGAICVFQRTIKPKIKDYYDGLKDCSDLWVVRASKFSKQAKSRLIVNRSNETRIYSAERGLPDLRGEETSFETQEPTILVANVSDDDLTLQIMSSGAQLISDDKTIFNVKWNGEVCDASLSDPHIVALTRDNSIYYMQLRYSPQESDDKSRQYSLSWQDFRSLTKGQVITLSLYKDTSGMFKRQSSNTHKQEELIYDDDGVGDEQATYWLLLVDDLGVLEIYDVPGFNLVYTVDNLPSAPSILADNVKLFVTDLDASIAKTCEILMLGMGRSGSRPILFVRNEFELVVYEAFPFQEAGINHHLKIRFKKLTTIFSDNLSPFASDDYLNGGQNFLRGSQQLAIMDGSSQSSQQVVTRSGKKTFYKRGHQLRVFKGIGQYDGVFMSGSKPHWFVMTDRGEFRAQSMNSEAPINAFCHYEGPSFMYFTANRELLVAELPSNLSLDSHWPIKKLPIKETVHFVNYHVESKIYSVITSSPQICTKIMKVGSEPDTMKVEDLEQENGYIPPVIEKFRLRLYHPEKWDQIPDCEIEFDEWEQVTCVRNVLLTSEGTQSGLKGYIAISTNFCYGEDVPNRGKIWILDLIKVVPEPDRPLTENKFKLVYCQEQKGPVTTLSHTCGLLMSAVGQKIYLWQLKEDQLDGVAFIDTQIYIHCAASVKNLILVSDVCKSVSLLRYQQETRTLSMVCRDSKPLEVFACDFAVDNELLNFVVADSERNILIYAHDPENEESHGGTRLLRRADFHLGAHITSFCRLRGRVPSSIQLLGNPTMAHFCRRRQMTMFCTVDGAIGHLFPVDEHVYRQFHMLQNEMTLGLAHTAGLNPKAWRSVKQARPSIANPCRLILDGNLIGRFLLLSSKERNELARKIGSTAERLLADIQLIQESTVY